VHQTVEILVQVSFAQEIIVYVKDIDTLTEANVKRSMGLGQKVQIAGQAVHNQIFGLAIYK